MHNLQNISSTPVEPKPAPRLTPSSSKPDPFSPLSPTSPSISQFATSFPAIEDLETSFQKTVLIDPSPSASDRQFPVFPSVPSIPVGARSGIPGPSLPSDSLQSTKGPSVPHDSSGVNGINRTSARPASMTSGLLKKQNSGGSSSGLRSQVTGGSSVPLKASTVLHPASQPSSGQFAMTSSQSTSLGRKPDIPITNSISPKTLIGYLDRRSNGGLQVLILDVRSREQFDRERIDSPATVCIEPSVLMRTSIDAMGVESALVLSPASEENSFRNREKFDVVVLHDEKSESFSSPLAKLNRIIYETEFTKLLQRPPMLLVGGLERWKKEIGLKGLVGHDIEAQLKAAEAREATAISSASSVRGVPNGHGSVSYSRPTNGQVSGYTQGSSTTSTDFRRPRSDSRSGNGGLPGDADTAEKERRRRAHVRDGAVFESSPLASTAGGEKTEQAEKGDEEPPARKSTLVRPSSSGAISAYNRPIPDTINGGIYTAHVPITYPSRVISPTATSPPSAFPPPSAYTSSMPQAATVLPPPQASLSGSPLSRRRSDYVEQSYFSYSGSTPGTMRASIDYPSLSAQNIVRYPPPVASTAMEKQGQRPRGHTASYSTQAASTSSTTLVNGKVIQDPPRIPCNYKVYYWSNAQVG
ncbi:ubiquitin-specific protease doa4, partial [Tulasnella sp. 403]